MHAVASIASHVAAPTSEPVASAWPVLDAHVAPPRACPSHCSPPFVTPFPQYTHAVVSYLHAPVHASIPVAILPAAVVHVAPAKSFLSHSSVPVFAPSPQ